MSVYGIIVAQRYSHVTD